MLFTPLTEGLEHHQALPEYPVCFNNRWPWGEENYIGQEGKKAETVYVAIAKPASPLLFREGLLEGGANVTGLIRMRIF